MTKIKKLLSQEVSLNVKIFRLINRDLKLIIIQVSGTSTIIWFVALNPLSIRFLYTPSP